MSGNGIGVIIAAKDAADTIARAVASALREPEVAEVIVVDDGSADATAAAAAGADDATGRLRIERLPANRGPSAARNHALAVGRAPLVAILDADDMILPGRFARLLAIPDWDLIADNIVFVPESAIADDTVPAPPAAPDRVTELDLCGLVAGSTSRYGQGRIQLGFLKPVMRRATLDAAGLRYDERARLGEDMLLYAGLLMAGARFRLTRAVGYLAVERGTSLSMRHDTADLAALLRGEEALLARLDPGDPAHAAMRRRVADTRRKWALRAFYDRKRAGGLGAALADLGREPRDWPGVVEGIVLDKVRTAHRRLRPPPPPGGPRLLMPS